MNNKEVAHLWANRSRPSAKGSHFYFEGDTIYSYGSHFPIARHHKGVVLFTTKRYSSTTAKHKSYVRQACSHLTVFEVAKPFLDPAGPDVKDYADQIKGVALSAGRARNPDWKLKQLEALVAEANAFCAHFKFKTRFSMPDDATMATLKERAKVSAERERKATIAKQAKFERECAETVQKWLAGESVQVPYQLGTVYLRKIVRNNNYLDVDMAAEMQTSKGALVPLSEAERAFRFAMIQRAKGWRKNGDQFKVGDYQLDAVNEQGVVAGCHRIGWPEIERFAKLQGWI